MSEQLPRKAAFRLSVLMVCFLSLPEARPAAFTPGNLAVLSISTTGASGDAAAVSLLEYTTAGGPVQAIAVPSSGGGTLLTQSNSLATEGSLSRSGDGRYLTLVGYNAASGTANVASTSTTGGSPVVRVIGRVGLDGAVDLSTTATGYSGVSIRSGASNDGSRFWLGGPAGANRGLRTILYGVSALSGNVENVRDTRVTQVFNSQLYLSTATQIRRTNDPLPTGGGGGTSVVVNTGLSNAMGFVFLDRDAGVAGLDTLYVADQTNGLVKYSFNGTAWTNQGSIAGGITGITGAVSGGNAVLYVTTGDGTTAGNQLRSFTDTAAYNATVTGSYTTLATAAAGTAFRGVAFTPIPEPGALLLAGLAGVGLVAARLRRLIPVQA
jgi:hypothetical protein